MQCGQNFCNKEDLVVHVNDFHVKMERPEVDYQCKWTGCPRLGKGFNARSVLNYILLFVFVKCIPLFNTQ